MLRGWDWVSPGAWGSQLTGAWDLYFVDNSHCSHAHAFWLLALSLWQAAGGLPRTLSSLQQPSLVPLLQDVTADQLRSLHLGGRQGLRVPLLRECMRCRGRLSGAARLPASTLAEGEQHCCVHEFRERLPCKARCSSCPHQPRLRASVRRAPAAAFASPPACPPPHLHNSACIEAGIRRSLAVEVKLLVSDRGRQELLDSIRWVTFRLHEVGSTQQHQPGLGGIWGRAWQWRRAGWVWLHV